MCNAFNKSLTTNFNVVITCEINLQHPTSLQVLIVAAYSCNDLLDALCILFSSVEAPLSALIPL